MSIGPYSFDQFLELVKNFHGYAAPGVVLGGIMVEAAKKQMSLDTLFNAISETPKCLPDAIQLLTPCTIGNGRLKIVHLGRYALSLYHKYEGNGVRVFFDPKKLNPFSEIRDWFFSLMPKDQQNSGRLTQQILEAGEGLLGFQDIQIQPRLLGRKSKAEIIICALCGEAFPKQDGAICRACQGEGPYLEKESPGGPVAGFPALVAVSLQAAVGKTLLHDMTRIVPYELKRAEFKAGQRLTAGDVCRLQRMGRQQVYIEAEAVQTTEWVHENDAAQAFALAMAGDGVNGSGEPSEGKVTLRAGRDGLLVVERDRLEQFNLVPEVMCASRQNYTVVNQDKEVAGTRAIPLYISALNFMQAMAILQDGPLFRVLPFRKARVGILVTGSEIFYGLVEDKFAPIITNKVQKLGCVVLGMRIVPDDREALRQGVQELSTLGCDLLLTTAGLSVDPDDVTRMGLLDAGLTDMLYGVPILPGAMIMLGRIGPMQVIGVPACALYFKTTSFDLLLPRLLAGVAITRKDIARLGEGSLCLGCKACTFPNCPFGK